MVQCSKCQKQVGCGCNLKNTLCSTCNAEKIKEEALKLANEQPK